MPARGKVRIIGGAWRGRGLLVAAHPQLRPTPSRVRETLFNWLASVIPGARCLDLFAGAGALGFEALSRGARCVTLVERDRRLARQLAQNKAALGAERAQIVNADALAWLEQKHEPFDVVFLDPPFRGACLDRTCALLTGKGLLAAAAHVYVETERGACRQAAGLRTVRRARAGRVECSLLRPDGAGEQ